MKIKGEARTREAEAAFVDALRGAPVFAQVVLEREAERAGGGWEFEISLPAAPIPPPFQVRVVKSAAPSPLPTRARIPAVAKPATARGNEKPGPAAPTRPPTAASPALTPAAPDGVQSRPLPQDPLAGEVRPPARRVRITRTPREPE